MIKRYIFILCIFSHQYTVHAEVKPLLRWYQYDLPPYHILRGDLAGQGPLDLMLSLWKDTLPDYDHKDIPVNTTRMLREFSSTRDHRCITGSFIFPESTPNWLWSAPIYVEPPVLLVTRKKIWEQLGKPDSIEFENLLTRQSLKFGHFDGRIYTGKIDQAIQHASQYDHVITVASHASGESLMKMLNRKRVDYILGFITEIQWLNLSKQQDYSTHFKTIRLKHHQELQSVHVGCVNTNWGKQTIDALNRTITPENQSKIWQRYSRWINDSMLIEYFLNIQRDFFTRQTIDNE